MQLRGSETRIAWFPEHRFALAQIGGAIDGDAFVEIGRAIAHHPDWQPGFTEVWDITGSASIDITPADLPKLQALEAELKDALEGSRTIVIVVRPLLHFSLQFYARMVQPLGREIVPVRTAAEAAALLGLDTLPRLD